jgi:hypothetical protein
LLDRYKNGNGTNNAADDGTSAGQNEHQYERTHARNEGQKKADQEDLKRMMEEMNAKMDTNQGKVTEQEEILAEISARMDTNLNEM